MREVVKRQLNAKPQKANFWSPLKQKRYFCWSMAALLLSVYFPAIEKQLLILSLIAGVRWVADSIDKKITIHIKIGGSYGKGGE